MSVGYYENLRMRDYLHSWLTQRIEDACATDEGWGPIFSNPPNALVSFTRFIIEIEGSRGDVLYSPRQAAEWEVPVLVRELVQHARIVGMFASSEVC